MMVVQLRLSTGCHHEKISVCVWNVAMFTSQSPDKLTAEIRQGGVAVAAVEAVPWFPHPSDSPTAENSSITPGKYNPLSVYTLGFYIMNIQSFKIPSVRCFLVFIDRPGSTLPSSILKKFRAVIIRERTVQPIGHRGRRCREAGDLNPITHVFVYVELYYRTYSSDI